VVDPDQAFGEEQSNRWGAPKRSSLVEISQTFLGIKQNGCLFQAKKMTLFVRDFSGNNCSFKAFYIINFENV